MQYSRVSKWLIFLALEIYALILAWMQALAGIRTDEAKYLLNIPYPHPPLIRWILSQTEFFPFQELFWRIVFASLLVQAVWLVWDLGKKSLVLAIAYVVSSAIFLEAGAIYMAPLTALQALLFLWLLTRIDIAQRFPNAVGFLWLATLFTALQGILLFPLVIALLLRMQISWTKRLAYFLCPILLLGIYVLTNPFIFASVLIHGGRDLSSDFITRFLGTARVWGLGGSFIVSFFGTIGIFLSRRWECISTFLLIVAYVALSRYDYYMILFTPLFVIGLWEISLFRLLVQKVREDVLITMLLIAATALTVYFNPLIFHSDSSRIAMQILQSVPVEKTILIDGSFGHQWQYESVWKVERWTGEIKENAGAVICVQECKKPPRGWNILEDAPVPVWLP